jgi:peptidyl-prolyl cis-trans isomerase A (cyclophilin A)
MKARKLLIGFIVAAVVAGTAAFAWRYNLFAGFTWFDTYEGTLTETARQYNFNRANTKAVLMHTRDDWRNYDYYWLVREEGVPEDGPIRKVQVPAELWQTGKDGATVVKEFLHRYPKALPLTPEQQAAYEAKMEARQEEEARHKRVEEIEKTESMMGMMTPDVFYVRFETTAGDFTIEFRKEWAPVGATRIYQLVREGVLEDTRFFRVVPGFAAQFGIPGNPRAASVWQQANLPDEKEVVYSNVRGTVTFAMAATPNSRTTQLFINLADNAFLDAQGFAPVGRVVEGMDAVEAINAEYGEGPDQQRVQEMGNAYLDEYYPNLTRVERVYVLASPPAGIEPPPPAPPQLDAPAPGPPEGEGAERQEPEDAVEEDGA